jgi:hypothetical protein
MEWEWSPYVGWSVDEADNDSGLGEPTVRRLVSKTNQNRVRLPTPMPDAFEADTCGCGSCLCADAEPVTPYHCDDPTCPECGARAYQDDEEWRLRRDWSFVFRFWYAYFRLTRIAKRWLFKPTPWKS